MSRSWRVGALALVIASVAGCEPAKYELLPGEVARSRPPGVPVSELSERVAAEEHTAAAGAPVRVAGRLWQATATEHELPDPLVRPVETLDGSTFHSLAWDEEPFDRLLLRMPGRPGVWREYLELW